MKASIILTVTMWLLAIASQTVAAIPLPSDGIYYSPAHPGKLVTVQKLSSTDVLVVLQDFDAITSAPKWSYSFATYVANGNEAIVTGAPMGEVDAELLEGRPTSFAGSSKTARPAGYIRMEFVSGGAFRLFLGPKDLEVFTIASAKAGDPDFSPAEGPLVGKYLATVVAGISGTTGASDQGFAITRAPTLNLDAQAAGKQLYYFHSNEESHTGPVRRNLLDSSLGGPARYNLLFWDLATQSGDVMTFDYDTRTTTYAAETQVGFKGRLVRDGGSYRLIGTSSLVANPAARFNVEVTLLPRPTR